MPQRKIKYPDREPGVRRYVLLWLPKSRYMPHQGKRECARRARRLAAG